MAINSIDDVIEQLSGIVDWARDEGSRLGYFAAMYRKVTRGVQAEIAAGAFEDAERMIRLVSVFAGRYLEAYRQFQIGRPPTLAWARSFAGAAQRRPIIIQQLLTGMNAHINLDLGMAAATVCPGPALAPLQRDFFTINEILGRMIDGFVDDVAEVSPWVGFLDHMGGRADQVLIRFSITAARDAAWTLATQLAGLDASQWDATVAARDEWTATFSEFLLQPGWLLGTGLLVVRLRETNDVRRVIDVLTAD